MATGSSGGAEPRAVETGRGAPALVEQRQRQLVEEETAAFVVREMTFDAFLRLKEYFG